MLLHPLYHWSPVERRAAIARRGLRVSSRPTCDSIRWDRICASLSPSHAWAHSAGIVGERGSEWDLWLIQLDHSDEVHVQPLYGNLIGEIRIHNSIPKSRLWRVGSRTIALRGSKNR